MTELTQRTLTGDEAPDRYQRPSTMLYCSECDEWILRRHRHDHAHDLYESEEAAATEKAIENGELDDDEDEDGENEDEDDEPVKAGSMYEIELSYSVDFRFRIPAWTEHQAKERAGDLVDYPNNCADMFQVHSDHREIAELTTDHDFVPDDYDPEMGTPLWEVYGEQDDNNE